MQFTVDQRKCDALSLLVAALFTYQKQQDKINFKILKTTTTKDGNYINIQLDFEEAKGNPKNKLVTQGTINIMGDLSSDIANVKFILEKTEEFSQIDLDAFCHVYREANKPSLAPKSKNSQFYSYQAPFNQQKGQPGQKERNPTKDRIEAIKKLEELGVVIFLPENRIQNYDWDYLAGYEKQKRDIEDTVLLALKLPEIYDSITQGTRMKVEPNRPKAVLFEGPPGTGKTTSAKIIAQQVSIPLIYMPIESIMSKYYGESEKKFADVWEACKLLGKTIIFIDEIDAIASARDDFMHEASRRILSTLLRKIDSFESTTDVLLICATNRKEDLDPAMLSRIDMSIKFEIPDKLSRAAIFQRYAKHLSQSDLQELAELSQGMSGRNISDICKDAERRWAAKLIRKEISEKLPTINQYKETINSRKLQNLA